jgi:hypothetical protein
MNIQSNATDSGISICVNEKEYALDYPREVWGSYPDYLKDVFLDNFSFLKILPTAMLLNKASVSLNTSYPLFNSNFYRMMLNHLPVTADIDQKNTDALIKSFMNLSFNFTDTTVKYPKYQEKLEEKAVINFTFGKESLLTFAVCKEMELPSTLVYVEEPDVPLEIGYKKDVIKKFRQEFDVDVISLGNQTALLRNAKNFSMQQSIIGDGQIITEYCLAMLPFSHYYKAKYIMFGNEHSCNMYYTNKDGYAASPVFDQTEAWMIELNNIVQQMTSNQGNVVSLVSPLHELSIIKILHTRYKEIGKYQMSCFPDENEHGKDNYWCHHCSKCARVYALLLANNINPKEVGFKVNMLAKEYRNFFSLFNGSKNMTGWDKNCGREEQLFSFYLAYKNGASGYLIDKFKDLFLREAQVKEDEFYKKFFSIYDAPLIPKELKTELYRIYKEELT